MLQSTCFCRLRRACVTSVWYLQKKALQRKLRGLENKISSMKDNMAENQHNWVTTLQEIDQQRQVTVEAGE